MSKRKDETPEEYLARLRAKYQEKKAAGTLRDRRAYLADWRAKNPGYYKDYVAADPEYHAKRNHDWYEANADRKSAYNIAYYQEHQDQEKARSRVRYWADPEKARELSHEWEKREQERLSKLARQRAAERKSRLADFSGNGG